ncbi:MAG: hypothetical protein GC131_02890 [Alphaproteobacteria bacterium]|nr:hypothetical protein [Alphaproteobacteria bacterium]
MLRPVILALFIVPLALPAHAQETQPWFWAANNDRKATEPASTEAAQDGGAQTQSPEEALLDWQLQKSWDYKDFTVEQWTAPEPDGSPGLAQSQKIVVRRGGTIRDMIEDQLVSLEWVGLGEDANENTDEAEQNEAPAMPDNDELPLAAITGGEANELVITAWSGGAHCCNTTYIARLAPGGYKRLLTLPTGDAGTEIKRIDGAEAWSVVTADTVFAYWNTSFAGSPMPSVIFAYDAASDSYRFSGAMMKRRGANEARIREREQEIAPEDWVMEPAFNTMLVGPTIVTPLPPVALWDIMLEYIYAGRWPAAIAVLDAKWPEDIAGRAEFLASFTCRLRKSAYWADIAALNDLPPGTGAQACPIESGNDPGAAQDDGGDSGGNNGGETPAPQPEQPAAPAGPVPS